VSAPFQTRRGAEATAAGQKLDLLANDATRKSRSGNSRHSCTSTFSGFLTSGSSSDGSFDASDPGVHGGGDGGGGGSGPRPRPPRPPPGQKKCTYEKKPIFAKNTQNSSTCLISYQKPFAHTDTTMARRSSSTALLAIVALAAVALATAGSVDSEGGGAATKVPRGVDPSAAGAYQSAVFTCDGGATVVDAGKINDEYCDCKDGTDEPGAWRAGVRALVMFAREVRMERTRGRPRMRGGGCSPPPFHSVFCFFIDDLSRSRTARSHSKTRAEITPRSHGVLWIVHPSSSSIGISCIS
jgi:hypothetical protein